MTNEEFYDAEIAPALLAIAGRLRERGMGMVATVEYAPEERGSTFELPVGSGLAMHMLRLCALAGENVDRYMINVSRHCQANDISTSASMFLSRMGGAA